MADDLDKEKLVIAHESLGKVLDELSKDNVDAERVDSLTNIAKKALFFIEIEGVTA